MITIACNYVIPSVLYVFYCHHSSFLSFVVVVVVFSFFVHVIICARIEGERSLKKPYARAKFRDITGGIVNPFSSCFVSGQRILCHFFYFKLYQVLSRGEETSIIDY